MVEAVAEVDDALTHKYLEGEELTTDELRHGLRLGTLQSKFVPVLTGSALKNKGIQPMLDAVTWYLPSPLDVPPVIGLRPGHRRGGPAHRRRQGALLAPSPSRSRPTRSSASWPSSGSTRARSRPGSYVLNSTKGKKERVGRILQMHANHREEIEEVYAGDIARDRRPQGHLHRRHPVAIPTTRSCSSRSPSRSRSSRSRSSPRRRPTRTRWASPSSASPRRTRRSGSTPTRRAARRSSPGWASSTSTSSSTG